jgi:NifU-like protein
MAKQLSQIADVNSCGGEEWFYSPAVKTHFFHPQNIVKTKQEATLLDRTASGQGTVGSPACGDMMKMWIAVKAGRVASCKWQTFGCASAIASTSMYSVMLTENGGLSLEDALKIKPKQIVDRLGGLPPRKFHCSVLADQAFKAAVKDFRSKSRKEA